MWCITNTQNNISLYYITKQERSDIYISFNTITTSRLCDAMLCLLNLIVVGYFNRVSVTVLRSGKYKSIEQTALH